MEGLNLGQSRLIVGKDEGLRKKGEVGASFKTFSNGGKEE